MFDQSDRELILYFAGCTLARVPGNQNWLEEKAVGGLPEYICRIARAIHRGDAAKSISQVIAIAVSRVKVWASGGGGVTAKTRAKAAKALAQWESKKKAAKLDNKVKASAAELEEISVLLSMDSDTHLTDAQLEKASLIPCTAKDNRTLVENIVVGKKMQQERNQLLQFSADKPHLLSLIKGE